MARAPNENAELDYMNGMKYKEIAEKYNVSLNTVKSWKTRYGWSKDKKSVHTKSKKVCTQNKGAKKGAYNGRKSEESEQKNSFNKTQSNMARPGNKNAETHGFFSKFLPEDTLEVIQEIQERPQLDIIWDNIIIQYAAIIRSQKIMYVKDKEEMIKELKKSKTKNKTRETEKTATDEKEEEFEYEFQFAWDRQATFLNAQSRAMSELRSLIKQYDEMLHKNWDLATEEQKLRINKLKADIENSGGNGKADEAKSWAEAIQEIAAKRRGKDG